MKRTRVYFNSNFLSVFLVLLLLICTPSTLVKAADNALTPGMTTQRPSSGTTITNPDGSTIAIPNTPVTVNSPDGSEYDSNHVINAFRAGGTLPPIETQAGTALSTAYSSVGISFIDGSLSLVAVPNFDFGTNVLDGKTRFVPLASAAPFSVGDAANGAFMDSQTTSSTTTTKTLRDPAKYRALVVSDSRLPIGSDGSYNGWVVSAQMTAVKKAAGALNGANIKDHNNDVNPDNGTDSLGNRISFAGAIEFGNGFGQNGYTVQSLGDAISSTQVSHPATYYNADPYLQGTTNGVNTASSSSWKRVDSDTSDVPSDNQTSGALAGLFFPRLSKTPSSGDASKLQAVSGTNGTANNSSVTTIPMSDSANIIWGYTQSQQATANNTVHPDTVSNGAWALDFQNPGSAIMALPKAVAQNRPGTYVYNLTWTLTAGFMANP